ncbi:type III-B CRISPR module RAMP protein Cmr6 [Hydrogenobacter thermophilus]|uniref:type III-B CRISPR module RAMP protein Cmr6 n=1 Tax=Hydrogenobacter thermophilus TaxID=940 RepID=UPI0030FAFAD9
MKEKNKFKDFDSLSEHMREKNFYEEVSKLLKKTPASNPALLFNKLLPCLSETVESIERTKKYTYLEEFLKKLSRDEAPFQIPCELLSDTKTLSFYIETAYRLAIGMGYPSLVENGLLFHHTYGIPYIPGETLKGLARGVFLLSVYEVIKEKEEFKEKLSEEEKKEEKKRKGPMSLIESAFLSEEDKKKKDKFKDFIESLENLPVLFEEDIKIEKPCEFYKKVFGTQEKRGEVIFFDAFPVDFDPEKLFEIDIMNPHYSEYYGEKGKKPPADWYSPVPIHFLTVSEGVKFKVCLAYAPLSEEDESLLEKVKVLLKVGLENFGVGGKKRKGYGWFKVED